jgi:ribosomal protein S18 acetylase RimI-like enzyme
MSATMIIRPAEPREYDEIARVWLESWQSTGLASEQDASLEELRARLPREVEGGWQLYVAADGETVAAMLAFRTSNNYLHQLFVAPIYQGKGVGKMLLAFTRRHLPDEIALRCAVENLRAARWYEREGFVKEREEPHPVLPQMSAYYRWKRG